MRKTSLLALFLSGLLHAQAPSDSLFNTDQVIEVHLTFSDPNFWNTLTTYYTNDAGEELPGSVTITDATGSYAYDSITVALKGNSSYSHPGNKKSFKVDFNDFISQKFHGMTKLHFNNCWSDPTFMREKLFFDYCHEQGVLAPRVQYANIYMNGTFWGFYDVVEAVDKNFLDRWVDDDDGNLFKAADNFGGGGGGGGNTGEADLKYYGADQSSYTTRYELKTNETQNDWSDLITLLDALNNGTDAEVQANLPNMFVWQPLLKSLALDNLFGNLDAYIQSARNFYLYHDSTTYQWNWIHWDANMAFGSYPAQGQNALTLSPFYVATNRPLMTRITTIPALRLDYLNAYCAIKENFTSTYLDPRIDAVKALIQDQVNADGNKQYSYQQFLANIDSDITVQGGGGGGGGGNQTIRGLRSFITTRNNSLSSTLDCSTADIGVSRTSEWSIGPNPCGDQLRIGAPSGMVVTDVVAIDAWGRRTALAVAGGAVDMSWLASGAYIIELSIGAERVRGRVVKR